jgi:hypothetical protein
MLDLNRRGLIAGGLAMGLSSCATAGGETGPIAQVEAAPPGAPSILTGMYDLASVGYQLTEFFLSGTASSYELTGANAFDARINGSAPYKTRIVVLRPIDASKFNGSVIVEWMNVSGGQDVPTDWIIAHREFIRQGYVHVGVSAQVVGIDGGRAIAQGGTPLKRANPERYGSLSHPGDAYSFDMFSQAGRVLRGPQADMVLGGLAPARLIAAGESQSAVYLTPYVNHIDPLARVYDGFLIHSRFGSGAPLDGSMMGPSSQSARRPAAPFRPDLRAPTLVVQTETDIVDGNLLGYRTARVPDAATLRVWEIAGAAHADNYLFGVGLMDSGSVPIARLAQGFAPMTAGMASGLAFPPNPGLQQHYVMQAAFARLDEWLRTGAAPPSAPQLALDNAEPPSFVLDANGIATGGLRTPWADVPTIRMSGIGNSGGPLAFLAGVGEPFSAAKLASLYPGGEAEYLRGFTQSLDATIAAGFLLQADREEILGIAAAMYPDA